MVYGNNSNTFAAKQYYLLIYEYQFFKRSCMCHDSSGVTVKLLSIWIGGAGQTVETQIRLFLNNTTVFPRKLLLFRTHFILLTNGNCIKFQHRNRGSVCGKFQIAIRLPWKKLQIFLQNNVRKWLLFSKLKLPDFKNTNEVCLV